MSTTAVDLPQIHILDTGTRSKLRSTQIITSLPQIVSELVQNSLDAGAKRVEVGVDREEWGCFVRDDGSGIGKKGLEVLVGGVEGGRYASSKAYNASSLDYVETFGFRGEAIASIADLAQIEISSKTRWGRETWSILLKGGKKLYYGPSTFHQRERAGTLVTVRDAFFSVPIRRNAHPTAARTFELVRRDLETFAIVFPEVSFVLEDMGKERRIGKGKGNVVQIPKTDSLLGTFKLLFGKALVEHVEEIEETRDNVKISGFVSLTGVHTKAYQFLYINKHILDPCDLHRLIDQRFSASSFGKHAFDETGETKYPRPATRRSPRKSEKKPAYVLNLHVPPRELDNCLEPQKSSVHLRNQDGIASFLADVIQNFLVKHGFAEKQRDTAKTKARAIIFASKQSNMDDETHMLESAPVFQTPRPSKAEEVDIVVNENEMDAEDITWTDPVSRRTYLIDPRTGNSYPRSKNGERPSESTVGEAISVRRRLPMKRRRSPREGDEGDEEEKGREMPEWMRDALEANNVYAATERPIPVMSFASSSASTMAHGCAGPHASTGASTSGRRYDMSRSKWRTSDFETSNPAAGLSRESLLDAIVVQQVDRKFVACLIDVPSASSEQVANMSTTHTEVTHNRTLYLIDQHAADERIRVERFLRELCIGFLDCARGGVGVEKRELQPSVPVLVRNQEAMVLRDSQSDVVKQAFWWWGFGMKLGDGDEDGDEMGEREYAQVFFECLPEVVADKLLANSAQDLTELVRAYLARLQFEGDDAIPPDSELMRPEGRGSCSDEFGWLKALRYCPRELVELVNSKACRGAIMFNDSLTIDQCGRLVRKLADCAFPFICAHGRPSIVPSIRLCDLRQDDPVQERPINWKDFLSCDTEDPEL